MLRRLLMWLKTTWGKLFGHPEPIPSSATAADAREANQAFERELEAALGVNQELEAAAARLRENRRRRQEALRKLENDHE
jgi:hypothetical protein